MRRLLRWLAWSVLTLSVLLTVVGYWLLYTQSGLIWVLHRGVLAGGGDIQYQSLSGNLGSGFELQAPQVDLPGIRINAQQLSLRLLPSALWRSEVNLEALRVVGASYALLPVETEPAPAPAARPGGLKLPIDLVLRNIELIDAEVNLGAAQPLRFSLAASEIALVDGKLRVAGLALRQGDFALRTSAAVDTTSDWAGELASEGEWTLPAVAHRGRLRLSGDLDALDVDMAIEGGGAFNFEANLARPMEQTGVEGRIGATALDLSSFGVDAPVRMIDLDLRFDFADDRLAISGPVSLDGKPLDILVAGVGLDADQILFEQIKLSSTEIGTLSLSGRWPVAAAGAAGAVTVRLDRVWAGDWRAPLPTPVPRINGNLELLGRLDNWQARLTGEWSQGAMRGPVELAASGTPEQITLAPSQIGLAESRIDFSGGLQMGADSALDLQLGLSGLDPALIDPTWPGKLDGQMHLGVQLGEKPGWSLGELQIAGELRAAPISLSGQLEGIGAHPQSGQLTLKWGEGQAEIVVGAADALGMALQDLDLSLLAPAQGHVSGHVDVHLDQDLVGTTLAQLRVDQLRLDGISGTQVRIDKRAGWSLDLAIDELEASGLHFSAVQLNLDGERPAHSLQLQADEARGHVELSLTGALGDDVWSGNLDTLKLVPTHGDPWMLVDGAPLRLAGGNLSLGHSCLRADPAQACISIERGPEQTVLQIQLDALALDQLQAWAPPSDWHLTGALNGGGALTLDAAGSVGGTLNFAIEKGLLRGLEDFDQPLAFDGELAFEGATSGLTAHLNLLEHGSLQVSATGFDHPDGQINAHLDITDLSLVDGLSAEVQGMRGALKGELNAPIADPTHLQGQLEASGLQFELPALGLKANDGSVTLLFEGDGLLRLDANMGIAPGRLRMEGLVGLGDSDLSEIRIIGENAALIDLPAVRLTGDSNFVVKRGPAGFVVEGGVLLREGKIDLDRFAPSVPASEDVVIEDAPPPPPPLPIKADISLAFIQAVDLRGFGLEATLGGGIRVTQRPGIPTRAEGEMVVKGAYNAYGQKLDIERGRLGFSARADNPSLDILAVKRIDRQRVGVQVRGQAKRPVIRLYSDPSLDQSETLSYLVLGRPLATAGGADGEQLGEYASALETAGGSLVAGSIGKKLGLAAGVESFGSAIGSALVVGKYLSPRFFVGYGTSLLDATQLVILRYRLTENIELEGISGNEQKMSASWRTER
jgi:translocation and assembly module TamB